MIEQQRLIARPLDGWVARLVGINWIFVLLLCALAAVGYTALYSAGLGPDRYANRQVERFAIGLVMMLGLALVDLRLVRRAAWPLYGLALALLAVVARYGHVGKGGTALAGDWAAAAAAEPS